MADTKCYVVVRIGRTRIGNEVYDTAEEADVKRAEFAKQFPGNEYAVAIIPHKATLEV